MFNTNQKLFYRTLNSENIKVTQYPDTHDIQSYWEDIWSQPVQHNIYSEWSNVEEQEMEHINQMSELIIDVDDVKRAIKKTLN
jgi:hypothetical protein